MPAQSRGSVFRCAGGGYGIRWPESDGRRPQKTGFRNASEARRWFDENVAARLRRGGPSAEITFDDFCELYLDRWGPTVAARTRATVEERLASSRATFGDWTLRELEGAAADVAGWRARLASDSERYRFTGAFRQVLNAAVRWRYLTRNPVAAAGPNRQPRSVEIEPFASYEIDRTVDELDVANAAAAVVAAETGLRTAEWLALERRDVDRSGRVAGVAVQRRVSQGVVTPYPKTARSRRRVVLTERALAALDRLPPRVDTPVLFPALEGGYQWLDNWRADYWHPALEAAGVRQRGPYHLRHTFATEALAGGISTYELARVMGTSLEMVDRTYGHLARDSEESILARLEARSRNRSGVFLASTSDGDDVE